QGDVVKCDLTSNDPCRLTNTVTSNNLSITVQPNLTPQVLVQNSLMCQGTAINFTATGINEGQTPDYIWLVNGAIVATGTPVYSSSTLVNGDNVRCILTSSHNCLAVTKDTSDPVSIHYGAVVIPTIDVTCN